MLASLCCFDRIDGVFMFRSAASTLPLTLRRAGLVALACSAALLSACGGGNRAQDYYPNNIVSFGDENSAIVTYDSSTYTGGSPNLTDQSGQPTKLVGRVYTVNTVGYTLPLTCSLSGSSATLPYTACPSSTGVTLGTPVTDSNDVVFTGSDGGYGTYVTRFRYDGTNQQTYNMIDSCNASTIWVQVIAHSFGKGYQNQCPTDVMTGAMTYAAYGARIADVVNQVAAHRSELGSGVLVTLMVGQWDVLDVYQQVKAGTPEQTGISTVISRAQQLSDLVDSIVATGAQVVLAAVPDLGTSPLSASEASINGAYPGFLTDLTVAFNNKLVTSVGRNHYGNQVAVVEPATFSNAATGDPTYVYNAPACDPTKTYLPGTNTVTHTGQLAPEDYFGNASQPYTSVLFCNSATDPVSGQTWLDPNTVNQVYMWADQIHLSATGHSLLGSTGAALAANNF
jgi:hypothetical protein